MFRDNSSFNSIVIQKLSKAELIEAYESAKQLELSEDFQNILIYALKLREAEKENGGLA